MHSPIFRGPLIIENDNYFQVLTFHNNIPAPDASIDEGFALDTPGELQQSPPSPTDREPREVLVFVPGPFTTHMSEICDALKRKSYKLDLVSLDDIKQQVFECDNEPSALHNALKEATFPRRTAERVQRGCLVVGFPESIAQWQGFLGLDDDKEEKLWKRGEGAFVVMISSIEKQNNEKQGGQEQDTQGVKERNVGEQNVSQSSWEEEYPLIAEMRTYVIAVIEIELRLLEDEEVNADTIAEEIIRKLLKFQEGQKLFSGRVREDSVMRGLPEGN